MLSRPLVANLSDSEGSNYVIFHVHLSHQRKIKVTQWNQNFTKLSQVFLYCISSPWNKENSIISYVKYNKDSGWMKQKNCIPPNNTMLCSIYYKRPSALNPVRYGVWWKHAEPTWIGSKIRCIHLEAHTGIFKLPSNLRKLFVSRELYSKTWKGIVGSD